jgi:hypothetical protein
MEQGEIDGNPYQVHKSGWTVEDFENRGYRVYGEYGMRWCRRADFSLRRPKVLFGILSLISQRWARKNPRAAQSIIAVKLAP